MGVFDHLWGGPQVTLPAKRSADQNAATPNANTTPEAVGGQAGVAFGIKGTWRAVWQAMRLPDPGTGNYAYSTLQLPFHVNLPTEGAARNGGYTSIFRLFRGTETPLFANQQIVVTGIPLTAGQISLQPLFDPNAPGSGYTAVDPLLSGFE